MRNQKIFENNYAQSKLNQIKIYWKNSSNKPIFTTTDRIRQQAINVKSQNSSSNNITLEIFEIESQNKKPK